MIEITLHFRQTFWNAECSTHFRVGPGCFAADKVPNPFRNDVMWLMFVDSDIGASYQFLKLLAEDQPRLLTIREFSQ